LLTKVAANYDALSKAKRHVVLDATKALDEVVAEVIAILDERLAAPSRR
jgi:thymidylate kinase